jgi:DDE superfamily endonuclease
LRALKKELNISFSRAGKAMEKERAMANQPETRLNYYRLILHLYTKMHIHRRFVEMQTCRDPVRRSLLQDQLKDFRLPPNQLIEYVGEGGPVAIYDQLMAKNDEFFVKCLDEKLIYPQPSLIVNGDEKPFNTHQTTLRVLRMGASLVNVQSASRAPYWTVVCWTRATGEALAPLVIAPGQSVEATFRMYSLLSESGASVTANKKGYINNELFCEEIRRIGPLIGATRAEPAALLLDGHGSRLQRTVLLLLARFNIYCVLEPSNSSQYNQPLDNGCMRAFDDAYSKLYAGAMNTADAQLSVIGRMKLLLQAYAEASESASWKQAWKAVCLPNGVPQFREMKDVVHVLPPRCALLLSIATTSFIRMTHNVRTCSCFFFSRCSFMVLAIV